MSTPTTLPSAENDVAALQAISGTTVYRVERDPVAGRYASHVIRPDGSFVTVRFDETFTVTSVEQGVRR